MTAPGTRPVICTIVARNYLAHARCLAESFLAQHPDGLVYVLLVDRVAGGFDPGAERFTTLLVEDLPIPALVEMTLRYDLLELCTAVKPYLLQYLLRERGHDKVCYLDPDIWVYRPLQEAWSLLDEHGLVFTPHLLAPVDDRADPDEVLILQCGTSNLGFIGVAARAQTFDFLAWWQARMRWGSLSDVRGGYFVDQKWMDLAPAFYDSTGFIRHPGYNTAYWNLAGRHIDIGGPGITCNGRELVFFHFSGFSPDQPRKISKYQNRFTFESRPDIGPLFAAYGAQLLAHGYAETRKWPNALLTTTLVRSDLRRVRTLLRNVRVEFPQRWRLDPAVNETMARELARWLGQPDPGQSTRAGLVTPVMWGIYRDNPALRAVFPDAGDGDEAAFAFWFLARAHRRYRVHWRFIVPVLRRLLRLASRDPGRVLAGLVQFIRLGVSLRRGNNPHLQVLGRIHL